MSMSAFAEPLARPGRKETRVATVLEDGDIPTRGYAASRLYCDEPGCDCSTS